MLRRTKLEFYCFIIMLYLLLAVSVEYNNRIMFMENDHKFTGACNLIFIHILLNRIVLVRGVKCQTSIGFRFACEYTSCNRKLQGLYLCI